MVRILFDREKEVLPQIFSKAVVDGDGFSVPANSLTSAELISLANYDPNPDTSHIPADLGGGAPY